MKPRQEAMKTLKANGYIFMLHGTNHDIYYNAELKSLIPLKRHDFDENDLRYIQKEIKQSRRNADI